MQTAEIYGLDADIRDLWFRCRDLWFKDRQQRVMV